MTKKKINAFLILRLLGIILFIIILSRSDLKSIINVLKDVDLTLFAYGIFFALLVLTFKALRWHIMNDGQKGWPHMVKSFGRFFESYALGTITPGRVGELIKTGHEKTKNDKANTVVRIISERGFDLGFFILVAAIALIIGDYLEVHIWSAWMLLFISIFLLIIAFLLLSSQTILAKLQYLVNKFPGSLSDVKLKPKQYTKWETIIILVLSVISNLSHFVCCYFLAGSVMFEMDILILSGGVALSGLINLLPITIMGMGTRELTFLSFFSSVDRSIVMAFSAIMLLVAQIGGGLISMVLGQFFIYIDKKNTQ